MTRFISATDQAETARLRVEVNRAERALIAAWETACDTEQDWTGPAGLHLLRRYHDATRRWLTARRDLDRWMALQLGEAIRKENE